jgi:uncharacterized protein YbaR (Trm112 family)
MNLDPALLEILVCPDCRAGLAVDEQESELVCTGCGLAYPVRDDIPVLLVDEARKPPPRKSASSPAAEPASAAEPEPPTDKGD